MTWSPYQDATSQGPNVPPEGDQYEGWLPANEQFDPSIVQNPPGYAGWTPNIGAGEAYPTFPPYARNEGLWQNPPVPEVPQPQLGYAGQPYGMATVDPNALFRMEDAPTMMPTQSVQASNTFNMIRTQTITSAAYESGRSAQQTFPFAAESYERQQTYDFASSPTAPDTYYAPPVGYSRAAPISNEETVTYSNHSGYYPSAVRPEYTVHEERLVVPFANQASEVASGRGGNLRSTPARQARAQQHPYLTSRTPSSPSTSSASTQYTTDRSISPTPSPSEGVGMSNVQPPSPTASVAPARLQVLPDGFIDSLVECLTRDVTSGHRTKCMACDLMVTKRNPKDLLFSKRHVNEVHLYPLAREYNSGVVLEPLFDALLISIVAVKAGRRRDKPNEAVRAEAQRLIEIARLPAGERPNTVFLPNLRSWQADFLDKLKPPVCDVCGTVYTRATSLQRHNCQGPPKSDDVAETSTSTVIPRPRRMH